MARISINRVFISGNLTHDPELRYTPSGQAVTNFSIANNRRYTTPAGEEKQETNFIRIVAWGRQAEICSEYLKKGSPILVEGRLMQRSWQTPEGQKRNVVEVRAQRIHFLAAPQVEAAGEEAVKTDSPSAKVVEKESPSDKKVGKELLKEEEGEEEIPF